MKTENTNPFGISPPMLSNRFILEFYSPMLNKEASDAMALQAINFELDFVNKTVAFTIQQPVSWLEVAEVVSAFVTNPTKIVAKATTGRIEEGKEIFGNLIFSGLKTVSHKFELNYASGQVAEHKVVLRYREFSTEQKLTRLT